MKYVSLENFRVKDIIFGEPKESKLPDGQEYEKIPISYEHSDDEVEPLAIVTDLCFSFGVQQDEKYGTYTLPLVLFDRNGPTTRQKLFVDVIRKIQSACKPEPKSCLYNTDERPTLYPKLIFDKYDEVFVTRLCQRKNIESNEGSTRVEPRKFLKKHCTTKAVIKMDSVFSAKSVSLQLRVHKAIVSEAKRAQYDDGEDSGDDL